MDYKDFKEHVKEHICDYLPENFSDAIVNIQEVIKNNDTVLDGLTIRNDGIQISPTIYLNQYFDSLNSGDTLEDVMSRIAEVYMENHIDHNVDLSNLLNFDNVKDKITCKLINEESNQHFLQDKPHTKMEDLAVIYQVVVGDFEGGTSTITLNDTYAKMYGIDSEGLHKIAMENMDSIHPHTIKGMNEVIVEMIARDIQDDQGLPPEESRAVAESMAPGYPDNDMMYIVSNNIRVDGAAAILDDNVRQEIAEKLGGDYYILPSSIHETIVVPKAEGMDYRELQDMVQAINSEQVRPDERLSDHVYEYDSKSHEISRCDRGRQQEQDKDKNREKERPSLKDRLAEKKNEVKAMDAKTENRTQTKNREASI